jgi:hypothetical protein
MSMPRPARGPYRRPIGRAVDRPVFWWSAGGVFLANAGLLAAEDHWILAVLHGLTCLWAVVAGVTAGRAAPGPPEVTGAARGTDTGGP